MAKKYVTSATCHTAYAHIRGLASTTSGASQTTYCGDHTLLLTRKAASTRKKTWGTRGRRGAVRIRAPTSTQPTAKKAAENRFSEPPVSEPRNGQCSVSKKYHTEPQSAARSLLSA